MTHEVSMEGPRDKIFLLSYKSTTCQTKTMARTLR